MQSLYFIFDNIQSSDMGIYNVKVDTGFANNPYIGNRDINEKILPNKNTPYFFGTTKDCIEFTITISPLEKKWDNKLRYDVARWLIKDEYKPLQFADDLTKIYYAICVGSEGLMTDHNYGGYVTLTFRTNSYHAWTTTYNQLLDLSGSDVNNIILENKSNVVDFYYPEIEFELKDTNKNITLKNLSDTNREFKFTNLLENEKVYVNNERKEIISDIPSVYRLGNFNKNWLRLRYGQNNIEVTGKCILKVRSQFPILV